MDDETPEKGKKGWLKKAFWGAAKWCTIGLAITITGHLFWQTLLDPLFFPVIHDESNVVAQSLQDYMRDKFGFVLEKIGLKGDGGILNNPWVQDHTIGPYMAYHEATAPTPSDGASSSFNSNANVSPDPTSAPSPTPSIDTGMSYADFARGMGVTASP